MKEKTKVIQPTADGTTTSNLQQMEQQQGYHSSDARRSIILSWKLGKLFSIGKSNTNRMDIQNKWTV